MPGEGPSPAPSPRGESNGNADLVNQLTQQLKFARTQLDKKSDEYDDLEERLQKLEAQQEEKASKDSESGEKEIQLTRQLKLFRGQLEEKSDFCDELAEQLRQLEGDLEERSEELASTKASLNAAGAEHRAAAHKGEEQLREQQEEFAELRQSLLRAQGEAEAAEAREKAASESHNVEFSRLQQVLADEEASAQALESRAAEGDAQSAALDAARTSHQTEVRTLTGELQSCRAELEVLRDQTAGDAGREASDVERMLAEERSLKRQLQEANAQMESRLEEQRREAQDRLATVEASAKLPADELNALRREMQDAAEREAGLQKALAHEKEMHDEVLGMLHNQKTDLRQEYDQLSGQLEQKEDEIMNIQFEMVGLQNKVQDHVRLLAENSEELTKGREQLEEKDGRLQHYVKRQEELVTQMNEATSKLQEKGRGEVAQLSHELDNSRAAYQTLEEHTQAVIGRLEGEREALHTEVSHARTEAEESINDKQATISRLESERKALQEELMEARAEAANYAGQLQRLRSESADAQKEARSELESLQRELSSTVDAVNTQRGLVAEHEELQRILREEHSQASSTVVERDDTLAGMTETVEALRRVAAQCGDQATSSERRADSLKEQEAALSRQRDEATSQLEELRVCYDAQRQREATLAEAAKQESDRTWDLQERLCKADERCNALELKNSDLERTLQITRKTERQALEKAQELRTSLALLREFGREDFMNGAVPPPKENEDNTEQPPAPAPAGVAARRDPVDARLGAEVPSTLLSVELDLGRSCVTLSVAPWQSRADFDTIVDDFLKENRVKSVFAEALVRYLEELESEATSFPVVCQANLAEVYSQYG